MIPLKANRKICDKQSKNERATFPGPVVEDQAAGWIELITGGAAVGGDGGEEDAGGEKNDKRGGEALVVMDPGEKTAEG